MSHRVIVCGGRDFRDRDRLFWFLDEYHSIIPITHLISGTAPGADTLAIQWATARGVAYSEYPADWNTHGRAAGPIRNQQMLTEGHPDAVIAFPGGKGTTNMIQLARRAGVEVTELE